MRRVAASLAVAVSVLACGGLSGAARGEQVPLPIDDTISGEGWGQGCTLLWNISDVTADPDTGTPVMGKRRVLGADEHVDLVEQTLMWPRGFTAWRVGTETEVVSASGETVLRTGGRYWMCPIQYLDKWVPGMVVPCPAGQTVSVIGGPTKCELGGGPL